MFDLCVVSYLITLTLPVLNITHYVIIILVLLYLPPLLIIIGNIMFQ